MSYIKDIIKLNMKHRSDFTEFFNSFCRKIADDAATISGIKEYQYEITGDSPDELAKDVTDVIQNQTGLNVEFTKNKSEKDIYRFFVTFEEADATIEMPTYEPSWKEEFEEIQNKWFNVEVDDLPEETKLELDIKQIYHTCGTIALSSGRKYVVISKTHLYHDTEEWMKKIKEHLEKTQPLLQVNIDKHDIHIHW